MTYQPTQIGSRHPLYETPLMTRKDAEEMSARFDQFLKGKKERNPFRISTTPKKTIGRLIEEQEGAIESLARKIKGGETPSKDPQFYLFLEKIGERGHGEVARNLRERYERLLLVSQNS